MTNPLIGYENFFADGVLTANSEQAGFEAEKSANGFLFDGWKPTGSGVATLDTDLGVVGLTWNFTNTADGWIGSNTTITTNPTTITLDATASNPFIRGPVVSFDGKTHRYVMVRIKRTSGSGWDGTLFYTTPQHPNADLAFISQISIDPTTIGVFTVITYDMHNLTAGGDDWKNSIITQIRFDFGLDAADDFEIDWIAVVKNPFADYWGLISPDIWALYNTSTVLGIRNSNDAFVTTDAFLDSVTENPVENRQLLFRKSTLIGPARYWRFAFSADAAPLIRHVSVGESLESDLGVGSGFAPPLLASHDQAITTMSESGNFIGYSLRKRGIKFSADFNVIAEIWVRDNWPAFLEHAKRKPFFFQWDHDNNPNDAVFCRLQENKLPAPEFLSSLFMRVQLNMIGVFE